MRIKNVILALGLMGFPLMSQAKNITVQVKGMVCAFCAQGIEKKFKSLPEVESIKVSLQTKLVSVETKSNKDIPDDQIKKIILDAGYDVVKIERAK